MAGWLRHRATIFTVSLAAVLGCNSPTLPLPPPAAPEEVQISENRSSVLLAGSGAIPGALVLVFNDEPSVQAGSIVTADTRGRYQLSVAIDLSRSGSNQMELWQRVGTQDSSLISFTVPSHGLRGAVPDASAASNDAEGTSSSHEQVVDAAGAPVDGETDSPAP